MNESLGQLEGAAEFKAQQEDLFLGKTKDWYSEIETPEKLKEVIEIIDYSKPLLEVKLKLGYKLFEKYPQLLY